MDAGLSAAVDELLTVDPATLSDSELHELVVAVERQRSRLGAATAGLVASWDRRRIWADDGSLSAPARLARETNSSLPTARVEVGRARRSASMPATMAAVAAGSLSLDHVDLLGRANQDRRAEAFAGYEATLVAECARMRFSGAVRLVAYWCQRVDADGAEADAERRRQSVDAHVSTVLDGNVRVDADLDPIGGTIVKNEFDRLERELFLADQATGSDRTPAQRRAAALVEMATRSASMPADARRPKPLFTVLLGDRTFAHLCELANRTVTTPGQVFAYVDNAVLESILFDGPTTLVSVSKRRTFTGALRRGIEVRDRHCQHPAGCDTPAERCDVDHIVPVNAGGITDQFDGRIECPPHNRHPDKHDHDATPLPWRRVDRLDELRVRIRWRNQHYYPDDSTAAAWPETA